MPGTLWGRKEKKEGDFAIVIALFHFNIFECSGVLNPVPEKARFITDYAVVTNGEEGAVSFTALACILFFGDIFPASG